MRSAGATRPAIALDVRVVVDEQALMDGVAAAFEHEHQVVAMRTELDLEVAVVVAEQHHLDHFVIPEPVGGAA